MLIVYWRKAKYDLSFIKQADTPNIKALDIAVSKEKSLTAQSLHHQEKGSTWLRF